jgi:hypothetical protein
MRRLLARKVQRTVAPQFNDATETLHTVAEAAVVANSMLEDAGNLPFLSVSGLDADHLTEINGRLSQVASSAWDLSRLLGETSAESDPDATGTQLSRVEQTLKRLRELVAEYQQEVRQVRERKEQLESRIFPWITPAAIVVSVVCFWFALSQVSLLCHARSWWKS